MEKSIKLFRNVGLAGFVASLLSVALPASAVADYTAITSAVDYTAAATAIVAIFALVAVMFVAWKGGKMVLNAIK